MNKTGEIGAVILRLVLGFTFFMHGFSFKGELRIRLGFFRPLACLDLWHI